MTQISPTKHSLGGSQPHLHMGLVVRRVRGVASAGARRGCLQMRYGGCACSGLAVLWYVDRSGVEVKRGFEFCHSTRNASRIQCLNTRFPLPTVLCAGYNVKLIFFFDVCFCSTSAFRLITLGKMKIISKQTSTQFIREALCIELK